MLNHLLHQYLRNRWEKARKLKKPTQRTDFKSYRASVETYTRISYRDCLHLIENNHLPRGSENHLDHIYSVYDGWYNNVPAELVGHWSNLRMLPAFDNLSKSCGSDKTLDQLWEGFGRVSVML